MLARSGLMSPPSAQDRSFAVLLPVKPAAVAKSRLLGLGDTARRELVVAFAADTASAALESTAVAVVLAVTDDIDLADLLNGLGAQVVPDGSADDLNGSLVQAAAEAQRRWPDLSVAALCADLPALRSDELSVALSESSRHAASFVADADRSGTTMLAAGVASFTPRFGPESRKAHLDLGVVELDHPELPGVPGLRRDVDTPDDLRAALRLGVGARTAQVVDGLRL